MGKSAVNAYKNHSRAWKWFSSRSKTCLCIFCTLLLGLFWDLQWLKAPQQVLGWNFGGSEDERWALLWVELGQTAFQEPFPALTKQLGTEEKRFRNSNYLCGNCRELVRRRRWGVPVEWRDGREGVDLFLECGYLLLEGQGVIPELCRPCERVWAFPTLTCPGPGRCPWWLFVN